MSTADDLASIHSEISLLDERIIRLIAERTELAGRIGEVKRTQGPAPHHPDNAQEAAVIRQMRQHARMTGLDTSKVDNITWQLIALARAAEQATQEPMIA